MIYNRIPVVFGNLRKITIPPVSFQYDIVQKLIISGLELPEYYQVDFCNEGDSESITMVGTSDGVDVPDQFLQTGKTVKAYLVLTGTDEGAVETRYEIAIPVNKRPTRTDIEPTPVEQSTIDSLIAAMNDAVDDAEASATAAEGFAENAEASAERAEQAAQGIDDKVVRAEAAAQAAETAATRAEDAAEDALVYKNDAAQSAGSALSSAEDARNSKETAIEKAAEAEQSAAQAAASAASAEGDMQEAEQAAQQAEASADAASQSATAAQGSATAANGSATVATNKAAEASASATTASGKATEAANSATAAQTAQTGAETAQQAAEEAAQEAQTILVDKAPVITDTASGAIATFPDGAENLPLKKLVAQITPVQDLHGYDSPWPAGGGVNKFDLAASFDEGETVTTNGVTAKYANGYLKITGTNTSEAGFNIIYKQPTGTLPAGTYIMPNHVTVRAAIDGGSNTNYASAMTANSGIVIVAFYVAINASAADLNWNIPMLLVEGTTKPTTYSPYSNLCPISGWTGLDGQRTGVNVWDEQWEVGAISSADGSDATNANCIRAKNLIPVVPNTTYYIKTPTGKGDLYFKFFDANGNAITSVWDAHMQNWALTTTNNTYYIRFMSLNAYGNTYNHDISINYPSTDHDYHAYSGESLSISWQDTAGTVYGGTMTVNEDGSGVLTVDHAEVDLGTLTWSITGDRFSVAQKLVPNPFAKASWDASNPMAICSMYKYGNIGNRNGVDKAIGFYSGYLFARDTAYSTAEAFKAALSGVQLVYELATPLAYHFDNLTQLTTLLGTNNIWVDTGDVQCEYRADTKLYIDKKIAEIVNS